MVRNQCTLWLSYSFCFCFFGHRSGNFCSNGRDKSSFHSLCHLHTLSHNKIPLQHSDNLQIDTSDWEGAYGWSITPLLVIQELVLDLTSSSRVSPSLVAKISYIAIESFATAASFANFISCIITEVWYFGVVVLMRMVSLSEDLFPSWLDLQPDGPSH